LTIKAINIAGLPFLTILIGLFVWRQRATKQKKILKAFAKGGANE